VRLIGRISGGVEEIPAFFGFEEAADIANDLEERIVGSGLRGAHVGFEFGESHLDRVQVGAVGRQEQEPGAPCLEAFGGCFAFVAAEIIEKNHVALIEGGRKLGFDIDVEGGAGHGTVQHPRSGQPAKPQACNEGLRSPPAKRRQSPQAIAAKRAAAQSRHLGIGRSFINKDKAMRRHAHEGQAPRNPESPRLFHISAFLLRRQQRFFYT